MNRQGAKCAKEGKLNEFLWYGVPGQSKGQQVRATICLFLAIWLLNGCDSASSPSQSSHRSAASIDIVLFYDDGTSKKLSVPTDNEHEANKILRANLASAFHKAAKQPRLNRWLIDHVNAGKSTYLKTDEFDADFSVTVSTYREYKVIPALKDIPAIPGIQARYRPEDPWEDIAGIPDPETGLNRAVEYLTDDLIAISVSNDFVNEPK